MQRPAAPVRGSAPLGSPRRVAPFKVQQEQPEIRQREQNKEDQQKERERQAEERENEAHREEVGCWRNLQSSTFSSFDVDGGVFTVMFRLDSEAAGSL